MDEPQGIVERDRWELASGGLGYPESNFLVADDSEVTDEQVVVLFIEEEER